jgi:hypothetical protein
MKEYLKTVIEENKIRPTIRGFSLVNGPYFSHKDFIKDKYVFRKKIFTNPRENLKLK